MLLCNTKRKLWFDTGFPGRNLSLMRILLAAIFLYIPFRAMAQTNAADLTSVIMAKDSLLFNIGFNECNMQQIELLISDDFEFYHDKSGVMRSKSEFIASVRDGLCKMSYQPKRALVAGSSKVYPMEKNGVIYGAVQKGIHRFYALEKDKTERMTGISRFTHLWLLENGVWQLARVYSFDHRDKETGEQ